MKFKIEQGRLPQFQAVNLAHMGVAQKLGVAITALSSARRAAATFGHAEISRKTETGDNLKR